MKNESIKQNKIIEQRKKKEYKGIINLVKKGNYDLVEAALKEYLEKYPGNSYAIKEYANILRCRGKTKEALELLEESGSREIHIVREKGYCHLYEHEYEEALKEFKCIVPPESEVEQAISYCHAKLGCCTEEELNSPRYSIQQIIKYDEKKALDHLKFHRTTEWGKPYFDERINVEQLFHNIQKILPDSIPVINDMITPKYIYHINRVGYREDGLPVNHLSVITLPNSYDILTMCPNTYERNVVVNDYERMLSMQDDKKEPTKVKVIKRESQIDKFNVTIQTLKQKNSQTRK